MNEKVEVRVSRIEVDSLCSSKYQYLSHSFIRLKMQKSITEQSGYIRQSVSPRSLQNAIRLNFVSARRFVS